MVKFTKTREWLIEEFVVKKRKIKDLAPECELSIGGLKSRLLKEGIKQEKFNIEEGILRDLLEVKKMRVADISNEYGWSQNSIRRYAKKYNIQILAAPKEYK